jgi:pyruvate-ferredoxin/flavodoxin oxidoreductase
MIRGTAQNPDVYFQARETVNKYYDAVPGIVQGAMDKLAKLVGRQYKLYEYVGAPDAEKVVICMGSISEPVNELVDYLGAKGEKVGLLKVRLFRPFSVNHFIDALPTTVKAIAVLDMTKEPGSLGEPLYEDVRTAFGEAMSKADCKFKSYPKIVGGRCGLGQAQHGFTPSMAKAVFDNLGLSIPKNHFTVGIVDDVTNTSLPWDPSFALPAKDTVQCIFWGLGSDGTVGANKNSIKIIGDYTPNFAQGYFVYDSKKAGTYTVSHLRFGKKPITKPYLIDRASFIACHKFSFMEKIDILDRAEEGGVFLLASPFNKDEVWSQIPVEVQKSIINKKLQFYVIDANDIAEKAGMGGRINVIMQTCFFKISGVLPEAEAIDLIKKYIEKSYGKKGADIVAKNIATIDMALAGLQKVDYPAKPAGDKHMIAPVSANAPKFVKEVIGEIIANRGDKLKVSQLPDDGTYPTGTTKYEKRNIAEKIPVWNSELCIQCGNCTMVCPHAVIRMKAYAPEALKGAPATFKSAEARGKELAGLKVTLQVAPEDCTGCGACVNTCPAKDKADEKIKAINLEPQIPLREAEAANWEFFLKIANTDAKYLNLATAKGISMKQPLFEFSGACAGCGETPYIKLMTQLYGDRAVIANATGCSSIYGGNLPTTPYAMRDDGRGPVWSNSLFEDAAEFGFGMRLTSDKLAEYARELAPRAKAEGLAAATLDKILSNAQATDEDIEAQRLLVADLKKELAGKQTPLAKDLLSVADHFIKRSCWVIGGDGWAYDIGYGGLDHVVASGKNINLLVLDTEVYSNTGGQMSKSTPIGAIAKFAAAGKAQAKKDLGMMAISYGNVYVAKISMGANMAQTIKAFREAESYDGPSLIIAYSHCAMHGIDMQKGMNQGKAAVTSGLWPLYRYDPRLKDQGKNPFQLDSQAPSTAVEDFMYAEVRFKSLKAAEPARAAALLEKTKAVIDRQYKEYKYLSERPF